MIIISNTVRTGLLVRLIPSRKMSWAMNRFSTRCLCTVFRSLWRFLKFVQIFINMTFTRMHESTDRTDASQPKLDPSRRIPSYNVDICIWCKILNVRKFIMFLAAPVLAGVFATVHQLNNRRPYEYNNFILRILE